MSIKHFVKRLTPECWNIGIIDNTLDSILNGEEITVRWMKHNCKNSWFADPFILKVTSDEIIVLCEEYYRPKERGRISRLAIDRYTMELKQLDVILDLDTHLSFPIIERKDSEVFIYPENGEAGKLTQYKYNDEEKICKPVSIISDEALADSAKLSYEGENYLFCTPMENPNGSLLKIYKWNEEEGKYSSMFQRELFPENIARMSGDFFKHDDQLYRPAQECNTQYGHAVSLQKANLVDGKWRFEEVRRLYSTHPYLRTGMHTFNMYDGFIITDALGFERIWIRKFLKAIGLLH